MNFNPVSQPPMLAQRPAPGPLRTRARLVAVGAVLVAGLTVMVPAAAGPVNVNVADARTLQKELVGIGPAKAQAIVTAREKNGPFKTLDEVARVKGVGKKLVDRNRGNLRLDGKGQPAATGGAAAGAVSPGGAASH
jgi:competence protein ComEA